MPRPVWRIARRPFALDREGAGARKHGGRWNRPGTSIVYAGGTIAIAALEKFVHLAGIVPADLVLVRIAMPERCSEERPRATDLPEDWDRQPPGTGSMDFGTSWARGGRSLVLYVPSILVPEEHNALINPAHPEFAGVRMTIERDFRYDPRMLR